MIGYIFWLGAENQSLSLAEEKIITDQEKGVIQVFRIIKALLSLGYGSKTLGWTVITIQTQAVFKKERIDPTNAGIHGLVGSSKRVSELENKAG